MTKKEQRERAAVVNEAMTWVGTPYHHQAALKRVGVDCGNMVHEIFIGTGIIERKPLPYYPRDFHLHRDVEWFNGLISDRCVETTKTLPGNIIMYRYGRIIAHAAIIIEWPKIIHVYTGRGVIFGDATSAELSNRQVKIYDFWGKNDEQ